MEKEIAQNPQRYPPGLNAYLTSLRATNRALQQKNADLINQLQYIQYYKLRADALKQKLNDLQQDYSEINHQNQELQAQIAHNEKQMQVFDKEREECDAKILKLENQLQEIQNSQQICEQERDKSQQALQESLSKANSLNENFQKIQAALKDYEEQLVESQQRVEQLQHSTKAPADIAWLNDQIQSKNKKIGELNKKIGELSQQNYNLNLAKTVAEQKLQDKSTQLETAEKALKSTKDSSSNLQISLNEKNAALAKWRQDYDLLKKQLDQALSINAELRKQMTRLKIEKE